MDPVSQTLAQQTSGSAEGQGFGQFFVEGARLRQNRDQLNLASRRVAIEERQDKREQQKFDLMLPLLTKQQELTNTNLGIEATARQLQLDATTRLNAALPEIFQLQAEMMEKGPDDSGVREKLLDLSKRYGTAFAPGTPGGNLWQQVKASVMFESTMNDIVKAEARLKGTGTQIQGFNPQTGNVELMREGASQPKEIQVAQRMAQLQSTIDTTTGPVQESAKRELAGLQSQIRDTDSTAAIKNADYVAVLNNLIATTTNPEVKAALETKLNAMNTQIAGRSVLVRTTPEGGLEYIAGPSSQITAAQTGRLREQSAYAIDTAKRIEELKPTLGAIFGPGAAAGEILVDRVLANFAPELANKTRIRGREAARYVKEGLMRSLSKGTGPLSDKDVARLESLYPALKGFEQLFDSSARARELLTSLQQEVARDAFLQQKLVGEKPTPEALSYLSPAFILQEYLAKRISKEDYEAAINQSPYGDEINAMIREREEKKRNAR